VVFLAVAALASGASHTRAAAPPRVTMIGDSVAASLEYTPTARAILADGVDLRLEMAPCRRVSQASCPYDGARPLTVVDLVPTLGDALGQTVVVAVGYNDYESAYAGDIEDALAALRKAGVARVLWLTLHEARLSYVTMNDAIHAAATRHPELTVVDWQLYSRSHPDWFQPDGIHLQKDGAVAMATLAHNALEALGIPLAAQAPAALSVVASRLPEGVLGRPYSAKLVARGGAGPFRWTRVRGPLPRGLRLRSEGRIAGVPEQSGTFRISVRATDANQATATRTIVLRVRRSSAPN
jgi:Putative Ig domain